MDNESFLEFMKSHKGKIIGIVLGFIFGILVLTVGFWQTLFLTVCVFIGFWLGGMHDKKEKFLAFLDKILPTGLRQ